MTDATSVPASRPPAGSAAVRLDAVLAGICDYWSPHRVGRVNDYDVRVVKVLGEFVEHTHAETDEFFLVLDGELLIDLPTGPVRLGKHDAYVVPRGTAHRPRAAVETTLLLFEPSSVINTGDAGGELTREVRELEGS